MRAAALIVMMLASGPVAAAEDTATIAARAQANAVFASTGGPARTVPALRYVVLRSGPATGAHPLRSSAVKVRYEGSLPDGTVFDSSAGRSGEGDGSVIFPVRGVIPGFSAAVQMMRPGDVWRVFVPRELAYAHGGPLADKDLVFRIELLDFAELPPAPSPVLRDLPPH